MSIKGHMAFSTQTVCKYFYMFSVLVYSMLEDSVCRTTLAYILSCVGEVRA